REIVRPFVGASSHPPRSAGDSLLEPSGTGTRGIEGKTGRRCDSQAGRGALPLPILVERFEPGADYRTEGTLAQLQFVTNSPRNRRRCHVTSNVGPVILFGIGGHLGAVVET